MSQVPPDRTQAATTDPPARRVGLDVARGLFLVAAVAFGWWGLRSQRAEIAEALRQANPIRVLLALLLVLVGLALTGVVWRTVLAGYGHRIPRRPADAVFFVGQLGKYIPGSVWALGAQADMARKLHVPARTTVAVGLVFLWLHAATAVPVAAALAGDPDVAGAAGPWLRGMAVAAAVAGMTPPIVQRLGTWLAGPASRLELGWPGIGQLVGIMAVVWVLYGTALLLVLPPDAVVAAGGPSAVLPAAVGAFALAYVVGLVVVLAPAGVGAREAVLIGILAPVVGLAAAAAGALLVRAVHTIADFAIAGIAWLTARNAAAPLRSARQDSEGA